MEYRGAMGSPYTEEVSARATGAEPLTATPGVSGYFTKPGTSLDPNIFTGTSIKPSVRRMLLDTVSNYLATRYRAPQQWLHAWLAGSGASYQWEAARDPGDLDVLLAVDHVAFREHNDEFAGLSNVDIDTAITQSLKSDLWPRTAHEQIGSAHYEVTFYVNPGHEDITEIHPYAAYDLTANRWSVKPIELPAGWDPINDLPQEYWRTLGVEQKRAQDIVDRYDAARGKVAQTPEGTPMWLNAAHDLRRVVDEGAAFFSSLHGDRRLAFDNPYGKGYLDYYNVRWQAYKRAGLTKPLHEMAVIAEESRDAAQTSQYGAPIKSAAEVLRDTSARTSP